MLLPFGCSVTRVVVAIDRFDFRVNLKIYKKEKDKMS